MNDEQLRDIGEFGLIDRIRQWFGDPLDERVVASIGDDTAVLDQGNGRFLLATCDMQVEGRHFRLDRSAPRSIGSKCAAVNLSDIAAMGGSPRWALLSLAAPPSLPLKLLEPLLKGLSETLREQGCSIIGGNTSSADSLILDLFLVGEVKSDELVLRRGAEPGDRLYLTGPTGLAAAGLALQEAGMTLPDADLDERLQQAQKQPRARCRAGRILAESGLAKAMIDVSDGLAADAAHISLEQGLGCLIDQERLPLSDDLRAAARALDLSALELALHGGEDYELLVALDGRMTDMQLASLQEQIGSPLYEVGAIAQGPASLRLRQSDGSSRPLKGGWDHFADPGISPPPGKG